MLLNEINIVKSQLITSDFWADDFEPDIDYQDPHIIGTSVYWLGGFWDAVGPTFLYWMTYFYVQFGRFFYGILWSRMNRFKSRQMYIVFMQFFSSHAWILVCLKYLSMYHHMDNVYLLDMFAYIGINRLSFPTMDFTFEKVNIR